MRKIARAKKNKEKIPTVDEFLWLIESGLETSDRIDENLRRCGVPHLCCLLKRFLKNTCTAMHVEKHKRHHNDMSG